MNLNENLSSDRLSDHELGALARRLVAEHVAEAVLRYIEWEDVPLLPEGDWLRLAEALKEYGRNLGEVSRRYDRHLNIDSQRLLGRLRG